MTPSGAELQASLLKAARALSLSLGICEDVAAAAPFILVDDDPNETLAQILHGMENGHLTFIIGAIDQALCDGQADLEGSHAAHVLLASAEYQAQRVLSLKEGQVIAGQNSAIAKPVPRRAIIEDALWSRLQALAAQTYVPATDASRLKGAGAGLTDSD